MPWEGYYEIPTPVLLKTLLFIATHLAFFSAGMWYQWYSTRPRRPTKAELLNRGGRKDDGGKDKLIVGPKSPVRLENPHKLSVSVLSPANEATGTGTTEV